MGPHSKMKLIEIFEKLQEILSKKSRYTNDLFIIYIFQKKKYFKPFNQINCNIQVKSHVKLIEQTICNCWIGLYQNTINTYYFVPVYIRKLFSNMQKAEDQC